MNKRTILAAAIAAFFSLALALNAADEKKKGGGFAAMDTDKDGKISKAEFKAAQKDASKAETRFAQLDVSPKDGFLSKEELAAGQKKKKN